MNPKTIIRPALISELPDVAKLVLEEFVSETHSHIGELESSGEASIKKFCDDFESRIVSEIPTAIFIAERDGEILGASAGSVGEHSWGSRKWGHEDFWYVKKEHRGSTVGIKLFDKLMDWFEAKGADSVHMTHYHWNPKVEKFYRKKGFRPFEVSYAKVL